MTTTHAHSILTSVDMAGLRLANRFAVAPMTRVTATPEGLATPDMAAYYAGFATGGFGLLITEGLYTDQAHSQGYLNQPGLADDAQARSWAPLVAAAHDAGARVVAQIMHAGALRQGSRFCDHGVAPSAIKPKGNQMVFYYGAGGYDLPREISETQLEAAIEGFVDAARRAVEIAGFDAIEIHGANGYLLDQFLTLGTNQRDDRWGGETANRVRLLTEVVKRVKAVVAGRVPVGIRISQGKVNDFHAKWENGEADAKVIFEALATAGVDFLHVTEFEAWQPAFEGNPATLAELAKKYAPGVTLIVNGSLHDLGRAGQLIEAGADIVAMGRGALANPDMPRRVQSNAALREFDSAILGPIADIKASELALRT